MSAIITLTTDLGLNDAYVGAMKGVILSINPEARIIDICHTIAPQDILQGAFVLSMAYEYFPPGTVHVVVVDPGVGTERRALILRTPTAAFVAPDNGALSYIVRQVKPGVDSGLVETGPEFKAVAITRPRFWRSPVSPTFHGRDIFAPVAARLSLGLQSSEFGEPVDSITVLPLPQPRRTTDGALVGHIIHIDSFGNLISDIREGDLPQSKKITIEVGGQSVSGVNRVYAGTTGLMALIGSSGYLEVALFGGSAQALIGAKAGDEFSVKA